jgi:hypothetical protein
MATVGKSLNPKSLYILILTLSIFTAVLGTQQAQSSSDDRQPGSNDDAITAGWKEGKNDYLNGNSFEYECSSNLPDTYCSLYRMGYQQGWSAQENLGREYGGDPQ